MKLSSVEILACPECRSALTCDNQPGPNLISGDLYCRSGGHIFHVKDGIPHFIEVENLTGFNRRFSREYDWFSLVYRTFTKIAFAAIGIHEDKARREMTDRLDPGGGRVLEVSIGPGNNLPYLMARNDVGEVFGLDISPGQLKRCQAYLKRKRWQVDLYLGNAELLPFKDASFAGVLHVGGINFFNDKKAAIDEMVRVAKPGARILIADETEKGARAYEKTLPGFKGSFSAPRIEVNAPVGLVPPDMLEVKLSEVWKGWFYCLEFRKP